MDKKKNGYWPTILIMEGRPYRLKELNREGENNPCKLCDLRKICGIDDCFYDLTILCKSDDRDDAWFFEEDWTIYDKKIATYLDFMQYNAGGREMTEDEAKSLTLKNDM